ncbi:Transcriptional regulator XRE family [Candidatus Jidaibacter acanthamoeba]|uniref:Transcriptional regulator XRE family n=1 Tax=Candidatus Jidaibacter acanthamoebae TaxID=86105 RepID=A0A0C1QHS6_9RICK|nr:helix-turn-helix transcriptional regulator [Candidatus Jidaibacter acanthamoeba]KIE05069.1 Transcriptional regulator XRE family [Candidatus Jidaibacter acanthamoeba]
MGSKNRHQVDLHVGQRLRKRRQELGMSQEKLGEAVQLTFQQIQKYEKGYNRISCSKLYEFAGILKTNIEYFFDGLKALVNGATEEVYIFKSDKNEYMTLDSASNQYEVAENINESLGNEIKEMVKYFKNISSKQAREHVLNLAKLLSENEDINY